MRNQRNRSAHRAAVLGLALLITCLLAAPAAAQGDPSEDRTLSPYFLVQSEDPNVDRLPLKSTSADVKIAGVIADVTVTQVYRNEGTRALEAIYVFPGSTRAAVHGLVMTIGERRIEAVIKERAQARADYEDAKRTGRTASLLEQQRPNVFQMNVANIQPRDEIKVELRYTELLVPTEGVYELVYPTVVGPRYSNQPASGAPDTERWVANPYQHEGEAPLYTFDLSARIAAGMPIAKVACPSHKVDVRYEGTSVAKVALDPSEKRGGNRDVILRYALAGNAVSTGLLLYPGQEENFFLLMVQPPERVRAADMPAREYVFVLDVSGSMHGFPLDTAKKLMRDLLGGLRAQDSFNVLLFAGGNRVLAERSLPANEANIAMAINAIDRERGGGGTELIPALRRALALPAEEGTSRTMVVVTDGYVMVEKEAFELVRSNLGKANLFAFGIGTGINRHLIEGLAFAGMGEPFVVTGPDQAAATGARFREYIASPVLTGARVEFSGFDAHDVEPAAIPDVFAARPVIVFGKYRGRAAGRITLSGTSGHGRFRQVVDVSAANASESNSALRPLWARHRIRTLADRNRLAPDDARVQEVTRLGLKYSLLTDYTSFIAVDQIVRGDGRVETVKQPLPLPQGVSDMAVGGVAAAPVAMRTSADGYAMREEIRVGGAKEGGVIGGVPGGIPGPTRADQSKGKDEESQARSRLGAELSRCLERQLLLWKLPAGASRLTLELDADPSSVRLRSLRATGGGDAGALEDDVRARLSGLSGCLAGRPAALRIRLSLAADGSVTKVEFLDQR